MEYLIVFLVALAASALTFFSGFGLGTILLPVFAFFMPLTVAVAATAIVHLANNLFKFAITFKYINWKITFLFGLPAIFAAMAGALLLSNLGIPTDIYNWEKYGLNGEITLIGLAIGSIIIVFAIFELVTNFKKIAIDKKWLPLGGLLSGFFGGLSGNQGALRSAFLIKTAISKEAFIATGVIIAVLVDLTRLSVYGTTFFSLTNIQQDNSVNLIIFAIFGGIIGALVGKAFLPKVTFRLIQVIVASLLLLAGSSIMLGIL
jgi:uncharacterized protein